MNSLEAVIFEVFERFKRISQNQYKNDEKEAAFNLVAISFL